MIIVHSICTANLYIYIYAYTQELSWMDFWGDSAHLMRWCVFLTDKLCSTVSRSEGKMVWIPRYQGPSSPGAEYDLQGTSFCWRYWLCNDFSELNIIFDRGRNSWDHSISNYVLYMFFCLVPKNHPLNQLLIVLRDLGWPLRCIEKQIPSVLAENHRSSKAASWKNHRLSLCCMLSKHPHKSTKAVQHGSRFA